MERKKKKMSTECQQPHADGGEQETIQRLFNKKFVYSNKHSQWSLKSTSVFSRFTAKPGTEQGCDDHPDSLQEKDRMQGGLFCHQQSKGLDGNTCSEFRGDSSRNVPEAVGPKELRLTEQQSNVGGEENLFPEKRDTVTDTDSPMDLCGLEREEKSKVSPVKHRHSSWHHDPQSKSSHFAEGRHNQFGNANKFQRKVVPVQRHLKRVRVDLPPPWQCDTLISLKDKLNALKDKLSDKEMIVWHQHTNSTNLAGKVVSEIKSSYNAELCTQAWCKFHEILASHDVVPLSVLSQPEARLNSIHLCEAPGAFITSLNHFLVSRGFDTRKWNWVGTTLNPYYEGNDKGRMINDDRFIRTTFNNWFFGRDNSGDLMSEDNMLALMERAELLGDVLLITADGSIDCQENPAEQEMIVSRLHHCEVLSSCLLLAPGGTLVIKLFTMLEASSIALLYFLNCAFEKVTVCKPATSKAGNSEVYAVCSGYAAPLPRDALFSIFSAVCTSEDPHVVLLPREDIPEDFLAEHIRCCQYFCKLQADTISQNLQLYGKMKEAEKRRMARLQDLCVEHYIRVCAIEDIDDGDRIRPFGFKSNFSRFANCRSKSNSDWSNKSARFVDPNISGFSSSAVSLPVGRLQGTFQQRQQLNQFPWQHLLAQIQDYSVDESCATIRCRHRPTEQEVEEWRVKMGQKFSSVASSHFCDSRLLGDLRLMLQHAQVKLHQQKALACHSTAALTQALHLLHAAVLKNHSTAKASGMFHLPLEGSVTSFWQPASPELSAFPVHRLSCVEDLQRLEVEGPVGVVVDVTCPEWLGEEEVRCQTRLLDVVLHVCSYLQSGSTLGLIIPVSLTRLSAGLLYIFSSLFQETSFSGRRDSLFLHQTLCFYNLSYPCYVLLRLLETLRQAFLSTQHRPAARSLSFAETAPEFLSDSCTRISSRTDECGPRHRSGVPRHDSVGSAESGDGGECVSCDGGGLSCHRGAGGGVSGDTGRVHAQGDAPVLCVAVRATDASSQEGAQTVSSGDADADRRMSHDGNKAFCDTVVECVVQGDSDRYMCHHGDRATFHKNVNNANRDDRSDRRLSHDGGRMSCHKCAMEQSSQTSDNVGAIPNSKSSYVKGNVLKTCADSGRGDHTVKPGDHDTGAKDGTENHQAGSITAQQTKSSEAFDSADSGGVASSGLRAKRMQISCDDFEPPATAARLDRLSAVPQPAQPGENTVLQMNRVDNVTGGCGKGSEGKVMVEVPLEVVPVLEMINDVTFTRFLQASNRHSISSFLVTMKAAEQQLLSQSTPS